MADVPKGNPRVGRGNFFAVDWRCVEDATRQGEGVNPALAYLTLARHTSRNHQSTTASATAICGKLGLSRGRAENALRTLQNVGLISVPQRGTFRRLTPWAGLKAEREKLTDRQREIVRRVLSRRNPIVSSADPDYQVAYGLKQRGILALADGKPGKSRFQITAPDLVWLPNTLVDGFTNGDGPLARLRQAQNPEAIRLLIDCYRHANLAEDSGLPWGLLRRKYRRAVADHHGAFTIWGFAADGLTAQWDPLFTRFKAMGQEDGSAALWGTLALLTDAGLIEEVTHLVEGLNAGAQVIYPYALPGTGEPEEREVQGAAHEAALRVIHPERHRQAQERLSAIPYLCPVRSHITGVEMVGVVRPTHRAHTKRTAAWRATFLASCAGHAEFFRLFGQTAAKSVA